MSLLNSIIDQANKGERVYESWLVLKNAYLRGEDGLTNLKNGLRRII